MTDNLAPETSGFPPRLVVSAPKGRSGKTSVCLGLCMALRHKGLIVQAFKKGPDYIDPSWLSMATGRTCRNLDFELMPQDIALKMFRSASVNAGIVIVEGAMGLYDSPDSEGTGSTAQLARLIRAPVLLVVDTERMSRSVAALVLGYKMFEPETDIAGIILNNVSGSRHESKLRNSIERYCAVPVLGSIPRDMRLTIAQRHLGIVPTAELVDFEATLERICKIIEPQLNIRAILNIANTAGSGTKNSVSEPVHHAAKATIGVIRDRVFSFYYPDNLEALTEAGAKLVFIDSLSDGALPKLNGLYIGGGFPELFLTELENNVSLRKDIASAIKAGLPVYAECAGLMYLCKTITYRGLTHEMVGVIPADVEMSEHPQGHGYVTAEVCEENPFFPVGEILHGHEFHHSRLTNAENLTFAYRLRRGKGILEGMDAITFGNVLASYTHLHALGSPCWAKSFVNLASGAREYGACHITPG